MGIDRSVDSHAPRLARDGKGIAGDAVPRVGDDRMMAVVRAEFIRAIGPMAHVVLDELLASSGADGHVPAEKWPELIEKLGWEIHCERRRVAFQKQALRRLQELR